MRYFLTILIVLIYAHGNSQTVYHTKENTEYYWSDSTSSFIVLDHILENSVITFSKEMDNVSIIGETEDFIQLTLAEKSEKHISFDGYDEDGHNFGFILDYKKNQIKMHGKVDDTTYLIVYEIVEKLKRTE
jgi:hypothetical protein